MRKTQNKRTVQDILHYIKVRQQDGRLQESMMTIAKGVGYSNATVHRALQSLSEQGMVQLIPSDNQGVPQTIYYMGPTNNDLADLLHEAEQVVDHLDRLAGEARSVMNRLRSAVALVDVPVYSSFDQQEYEVH